MPRLIDLSREIHHRMPTFPTHSPVAIAPWGTHSEIKQAGGVTFSSASMMLTMGDHAGTHVDAPAHFDADPNALTVEKMPLDLFYASAFCLDLSHLPLKSDITVADLEKAETTSGETIGPRDIILLSTVFNNQVEPGSPAFYSDFCGLTEESATWLGNKGITAFGVEAISPGRPGANNYRVHQVCRDLGFTHIEGLVNLDQLVGKGRFRFIGFPLKIRGGTGSPIRAVAVLDE